MASKNRVTSQKWTQDLSKLTKKLICVLESNEFTEVMPGDRWDLKYNDTILESCTIVIREKQIELRKRTEIPVQNRYEFEIHVVDNSSRVYSGGLLAWYKDVIVNEYVKLNKALKLNPSDPDVQRNALAIAKLNDLVLFHSDSNTEANVICSRYSEMVRKKRANSQNTKRFIRPTPTPIPAQAPIAPISTPTPISNHIDESDPDRRNRKRKHDHRPVNVEPNEPPQKTSRLTSSLSIPLPSILSDESLSSSTTNSGNNGESSSSVSDQIVSDKDRKDNGRKEDIDDDSMWVEEGAEYPIAKTETKTETETTSDAPPLPEKIHWSEGRLMNIYSQMNFQVDGNWMELMKRHEEMLREITALQRQNNRLFDDQVKNQSYVQNLERIRTSLEMQIEGLKTCCAMFNRQLSDKDAVISELTSTVRTMKTRETTMVERLTRRNIEIQAIRCQTKGLLRFMQQATKNAQQLIGSCDNDIPDAGIDGFFSDGESRS